MKTTRNDLKRLIKECLIEILNEGLAGSLVAGNQAVRQENRTQAPRMPAYVAPATSQRVLPQPRVTPQVDPRVKLVAGGNPIMESIIADTLNTTYQQQTAAEPANQSRMLQSAAGPNLPPGFDPSLLEGYSGSSMSADSDPDPSSLTGEAAHWAAILDRA